MINVCGFCYSKYYTILHVQNSYFIYDTVLLNLPRELYFPYGNVTFVILFSFLISEQYLLFIVRYLVLTLNRLFVKGYV